jgi:hypothetical protein
MTEGKSAGDLIRRFMAFLQGLGKPKDNLVLRPQAATSLRADAVAPNSDKIAAGEQARESNNRSSPVTEKSEPNREQWQKLKDSAKACDPAESNIDHWNHKKGGILSGTTFDAATTDISHGARPRKRPSVVTQARITSNRLQALQAQIDKSSNEFDKAEETDT